MKWVSPHLREVTGLFLRLGFTAFGGPAAHIALMHDETVTRRKWLTDEEFLDLLGTTDLIPDIFLPSFVFVALTAPILPRLRDNPHWARLLDGVNAAALGLMAAVSLTLARAALLDVWKIGAVALALFLLLRYRLNATWLIAGGALLGLLRLWVG